MAEYLEEQADEKEALEAIFLDDYECINETTVALKLTPFSEDAEEENHVGVRIIFSFPEKYPSVVPEIKVESTKGLKEEQCAELKDKLDAEATQSLDMVMVYTLSEVAKEWLEANNTPERTDDSMYADMMQRKKEEQDRIEAERKELERKEMAGKLEANESAKGQREKYGTPVTKESFATWKKEYLISTQDDAAANAGDGQGSKKNTKTGKEHFVSLSTGDSLVNEGENVLKSQDWDAGIDPVEEALFLEEDLDLSDLDDLSD